jgi:predicted MPP superfamily phosphohydrolase
MGLIVWSILFGRYNYRVETAEIFFDNLPQTFDGYKIVQISDVHAGSYAGKPIRRFEKAVAMINAQHPDIVVFTGDMVNNFSEELTPLVPIFSQLQAKDGKYAVLGNHDYGGYYRWKSVADSTTNQTAIEHYISMMGFVLLKNRAVTLSRDSAEQIALIGVENWGVKKRFPKRADIETAMLPVIDIPFKLLLSHDPAYWEKRIALKADIALTLSGHSHGMQMGVKLGRQRFSPASVSQRYWAGLYRTDGRYLYVNRGLGVIVFPGRIGMSPEITVITLRKRNCNDKS